MAKQGDARDYCQLAILFSDGDGVERNRATGYRFPDARITVVDPPEFCPLPPNAEIR